jgi:hypothetical protein
LKDFSERGCIRDIRPTGQGSRLRPLVYSLLNGFGFLRERIDASHKEARASDG